MLLKLGKLLCSQSLKFEANTLLIFSYHHLIPLILRKLQKEGKRKGGGQEGRGKRKEKQKEK